MRKIAVILAATFALSVPLSGIASADTEHCPKGWRHKLEAADLDAGGYLSEDGVTITVKGTGYFCFKAGTEVFVVFLTKGQSYTMPNGKQISYAVCYPRGWQPPAP